MFICLNDIEGIRLSASQLIIKDISIPLHSSSRLGYLRAILIAIFMHWIKLSWIFSIHHLMVLLTTSVNHFHITRILELSQCVIQYGGASMTQHVVFFLTTSEIKILLLYRHMQIYD